MTQSPSRSPEQVTVHGDQLVAHIKELIHEGNVTHIVISHEGHTIIEIPVTIGAVGAVLAPMFAAVGAMGALLTDCTIAIVRRDETDNTAAFSPSPDVPHADQI